jgi:hypothetical protein
VPLRSVGGTLKTSAGGQTLGHRELVLSGVMIGSGTVADVEDDETVEQTRSARVPGRSPISGNRGKL